jgi:hypothetical protein
MENNGYKTLIHGGTPLMKIDKALKFTLLTVAFLLSALETSAKDGQAAFATVKSIIGPSKVSAGKVSVRIEKQANWTSASIGTNLHRGDLIFPDRGVRVSVSCPDDTTTLINAGVPSSVASICPKWKPPIAMIKIINNCREGYVRREALPDDQVCVTQETRDQAFDDDRQAADRIDPVDHTYGPDTCIQGYVWREAVPDDHVCVTPETRSQAAYDNSQASERSTFP